MPLGASCFLDESTRRTTLAYMHYRGDCVLTRPLALETASSDHILATLALRFVASHHSLAAFNV